MILNEVRKIFKPLLHAHYEILQEQDFSNVFAGI